MTRSTDGHLRFGCFVGVDAAVQQQLSAEAVQRGGAAPKQLEQSTGICGPNDFMRPGIAQNGDDVSPGLWHMWATSSGKQASNEARIAQSLGLLEAWKSHQHRCISLKSCRFDFKKLKHGRLKTTNANKGRLLQWVNLPAEEVWTCTGNCLKLRKGTDTRQRYYFIGGWRLEALARARRLNNETWKTAQTYNVAEYQARRRCFRAQRLALNNHWALMVGAENLTPKYPAGAFLIPSIADKLPPELTLAAISEQPTERHHCGRNREMKDVSRGGRANDDIDGAREFFLESLLRRVGRKMAQHTGHFTPMLRKAMGLGPAEPAGAAAVAVGSLRIDEVAVATQGAAPAAAVEAGSHS